MTDLDAGVRGAQLVDAAESAPLTGVDELSRRVEAGKFFWLDLTRPSPALMGSVAGALGLTEAHTRYLLTTGQDSELRVAHGDIWAIAYGMQDRKELAEVHAVYTGSFLITAHDASCPALGEAGDRYQQLTGRDQGDASLVLFMVLDALAASFQVVLGLLYYRTDELEAHALRGEPAADYFQQVGDIRQMLTRIMRAIGPYRSDLAGVLGAIHRFPGMGPGAQDYFESHRNHLGGILELAYDCRNETRDALQIYSSLATDRQGWAINWLAVLAAVIAPLTVLTAYFGMDFSVFTGARHGLHGWPVFIWLGVVLPVLLVIAMVVLVRRVSLRLGVRLRPGDTTGRLARSDAGGDKGEV